MSIPSDVTMNGPNWMGILPRNRLPRYGRRLADVPLDSVCTPGGIPKEAGCVGDLGPDDELVFEACSKSVLGNFRGVRCKLTLMLMEPPAIHGRFYRAMPLIARRFHRVLTYHPQLLKSIPNACFLAHGNCWVKDPLNRCIVSKTRMVSLVASSKNHTGGHRMRHAVVDWAIKNGYELDALGHGYAPIAEKGLAHDRYRFSVVIENSRSPNYFTEKLIDCLICRCVPIYWGAPEIADFLDPNGLIVCRDLNEIIERLGQIDESLYESLLPSIERNHRLAIKYSSRINMTWDALRSSCRINNSDSTTAPTFLKVSDSRQESLPSNCSTVCV